MNLILLAEDPAQVGLLRGQEAVAKRVAERPDGGGVVLLVHFLRVGRGKRVRDAMAALTICDIAGLAMSPGSANSISPRAALR